MSDHGPSVPVPGLETGPTTFGHIRPGVNILTISFDLQELLAANEARSVPWIEKAGDRGSWIGKPVDRDS